MRFQALPGFRDFFPAEMAVRRHVEDAWHAASKAAGFEEIDGPPLESLDLFKAKSGNEIIDQLYVLNAERAREEARLGTGQNPKRKRGKRRKQPDPDQESLFGEGEQ